MGQSPSTSRLGKLADSIILQRSGRADQVARNGPVTAGLQVSNEYPYLANAVFPPGFRYKWGFSPTSQPVTPPVFPSMLDAASDEEIGKALGARMKHILRPRKPALDPFEYEQFRGAWRFQEANPYAATLPIDPTGKEVRTCPFFSPGCNCMIGSAPYYPSYYLNRRGDEYSQYVTKMAYIPGVLPTVPPWQGQAKKPSEPPTCKPQDLVLEPPNIGLATFEDEAQGWANSSATGPTASSHVISPRVPASIGMLAASTRPSGSFGGNGLPSPVPAVTDGHVQSSAPWLTGTLVAPSGPGHVVGVAQPSPGRKRALEDEESSDSAEDRQPKPKRKKTNQGVKDDHEKQLIARYMQEEIDKNNVTETKWQNIAEKLKRHGFSRSGNSVKAYWSRHGRQEFGMDERRKPEGRKLVTSKQDPEERRKARERKKREAAEGADL